MEESTASQTANWYANQAYIPNRCSMPTIALADVGYQQSPQPLELRWVRTEHEGLFNGLAEISDANERRLIFHEYAISRFWLNEPKEKWPPTSERIKRSHIGVLRGWGVDSNGPSGAVFKGWAESRFGLRTLYHGDRLAKEDGAVERYEGQRMRGATSGIGMLLDLLYTFCQEELHRSQPSGSHQILYRGTHDPEAYLIKDPNAAAGELVEFNAVSSFTSNVECAWEFGSAVWKVEVPLSKIVFYSGLLPHGLLQGEDEYIVLGGDYQVRRLQW